MTLEAPAVDTDGYGSVYTYHVEAVVTDEAGETQSASYNLLAGPKAYSFDIRLPQYVCKEDSMLFTFGVNNVMNIPQHIEGSYCLYPFAEQNGQGILQVLNPWMMLYWRVPSQPIGSRIFGLEQASFR